MFKLTCKNTFTSHVSRKSKFYIEKQQNFKPTNLLKKPLLFIRNNNASQDVGNKAQYSTHSYSIFPT